MGTEKRAWQWMVRANLEAIIVRCEEGDPRTDWLPIISQLARNALDVMEPDLDDFVANLPPPPPSLFFVCKGQPEHDFVAGPYMAICNRCEKVVSLVVELDDGDEDA